MRAARLCTVVLVGSSLALGARAWQLEHDRTWLGQVSHELERAEYEFHPVAGEANVWSAPNRAHEFRSRVSTDGVEVFARATSADGEDAAWKLNLRTASFGRVGAARSLHDAVLAAQAGRVELDHGPMVEWFENSSRGLEQGWTIATRPDGDAPLWIGLDFGRDLSLRIDDGATSGVLVDASGVVRLRYGKLLAFDATGRELCSRIVASCTGVEVEVDDENASYPLTVDPMISGPTWSVYGDQVDAGFGNSVSGAGDVNGDGFSDVIIGASDFDNGETDEGRAFVYLGSASGLGATPAWTAECNQASAYFGQSVSTAGDVNGDGYDDVIIGARTFDNGEADEGRAFVYLGSASGLGATPAWTAESNQAGALFASGVSNAGDVNGDGFGDVIIGAARFDNGETDEGSVFVYLGSASGLAASAFWTFEGNQANAQLGETSAANAGDVNDDGYGDVIVGARFYDNGEVDEGAVWVFFGSPSGLISAWFWDPDLAGAEFGRPVAGAGDVNNDGFDDVLIGATRYSNGQANEGRVFLFHGDTNGLSGNPNWIGESNQSQAFMGSSLDTAGDLNGDGYADVVVGAFLYDGLHTDGGRVYVYMGSAAGLNTNASASIEGDQPSAEFGVVACAGDVNGDGYSDFLTAAVNQDDDQTNEGRVSLWMGAPALPATSHAWSAEPDQVSALFGFSVAGAGDVNGDGFDDVIVGAFKYDSGQTDEGAAFVYHGSASGLLATPTWSEESNQTAAQFGYSVSGAGDVNGDGFDDVIVGAPTASGAGDSYVYLGSASGLQAYPIWAYTPQQANARCGDSVSAAGDVNGDGFADVVVSAPAYDGAMTDQGRVFVFHGSAGAMHTTPATALDGDSSSGTFGSALACAGDVNGDGFSDVVVGDFFSGIGGRAFVYHGSQYGLATAPAWSATANQPTAYYGSSVSSAGDVNGDGFSDVVVGAANFSNGQAGEGRAHVYMGSSSGLSASAAWTTESQQSAAALGAAVAGAGDVDGDGYDNVLVSAPYFDGGQTDEGRVWLYQGGASGLIGPVWQHESDQAGAQYGVSLAGAGDVDGDGFGDMIVGSWFYSAGQADEGAAFVYLGNEGRGSAVRGAQQRRSDDSARIATLGRSDSYDSVRLALTLEKLPVPTTGSDLAWLEWEVKPLGTPLDGTNLGRGPIGQPIAGNLPLAFNELVTGLTSTQPYQWRVRIATDNPLYPHTPWVTQGATGKTAAKFRTLAGVVCPTPLNYCTSSSTTNGCAPTMSSAGTPSYTASSGFTLVANNLEGAKTGLIFYGVNGTHNGAWGTGFLCVKAPTQRTPSGPTGGTSGACDGSLSIDWLDYMSTHPGAIGHPLLEGETFWAQAWFRDPPAPKTTNLTDGLRFTLCL